MTAQESVWLHIHIKFKKRQNDSVIIDVRLVVNSGGYAGKGQQRKPYRVLKVSYILISVVIAGANVKKKAKTQTKVCTLCALVYIC